MVVFRPADAVETAAGWACAMRSEFTPTALILTRQNVEQLEGTSKEAMKGGYIVSDCEKEIPEGIIIASGSEVAPAIKAQKRLREEGIDVRVVSMPSMELFLGQPESYKESVLPDAVRARVAAEASQDFGWYRFVGLDGKVVGMNGFGTSAPGGQLFDHFGINADGIYDAMKEVLEKNRA